MITKTHQVHLLVSGDVTGVGYRYWAKREAEKMSITGWVRNKRAQLVEIVAQGSEEALQHFISSCHQGPDVCWVQTVETAWQPLGQVLTSFSIL